MATFWIAGQQITATDLNRMFGEGSWTLTYNTDGTVATAVDVLTSTTYTFIYDSTGKLTSYTDGTTTWTLAYNTDDDLISITTS